MNFINIGKTFKTKTGNTILKITPKDLEVLSDYMETHEKYGDQVSVIITKSKEEEYPVGVSIITDMEKKPEADHSGVNYEKPFVETK